MTAGERRRSGRTYQSPSARPRNKGGHSIEKYATLLPRYDNAIECTYTPVNGLNEGGRGTSLMAVDGQDTSDRHKILLQTSTIPDTCMRAKLTRAMLQQLKTSPSAKTANGRQPRPQSAPAGGRQQPRSSRGDVSGGGLHSAARAGRKSHGGLAHGYRPDTSIQNSPTRPGTHAPRPRSAPIGGRTGGATTQYLPPWVKPADWEAIVAMGAKREPILQRPGKAAWVRPWYDHPHSAARGGSVVRLFDP